MSTIIYSMKWDSNMIDKAELLKRAKERNPNLTREQAKQLLMKADQVASKTSQPADDGKNPIVNFLIPRTYDYAKKLEQGVPLESDKVLQNKGGPLEFMKARFKEQLPVAGELSTYALPGLLGTFGKLFGGANAGARIGDAALKSGIIGGVSGVTKDANNLQERAQNAAVSGGTSAALGGVLQAGSEGANALVGKLKEKAPDIFRSTLKETAKAERGLGKTGGVDELMAKMDKYKIPNTKDGVEKAFDNYRKDFATQVQKEIALSANTKGKVIDLEGILKTSKSNLQDFNRPESRAEYKEAIKYIDDAIATYGKNKQLDVDSANRLREFLDSRLPYGKPPADWTVKDLTVKDFAGQLRNEVQNNVPSTKPLFEKYTTLVSLKDMMKKEPNISLPELTGMSVFAPAGPLGALFGLLGAKAARSPGLLRAGSRMTGSLPNTPSVGSSAMLSIEALKRSMGMN